MKEDSLKYVKHKFIFRLQSKKIKIPVYENRNDKAFLKAPREFGDRVGDYNFTANNAFARRAFMMSNIAVSGRARDTWSNVLADSLMAIVGARDMNGRPVRLAAFRDKTLEQGRSAINA